ncbi:MAG: collagenase [Sarcina sp.]
MLKSFEKKFFRILLFSFCIIFIFGSFSIKITLIKASHIVELINNDFHPNLKKYEIDNYTFLYDTQESKDDIPYIKKTLDENKEKILNFLGIKTEPNLTIRVLTKFNKKHSDALGYVYFHNNIVNIVNTNTHKELIYSDNTAITNDIFQETLLHEYTHSLINQKLIEKKIYPNKLPFWFNEGIAEYIGKITTDKDIPTSSFSEIKPTDLDKLFQSNSSKFYKESSIYINNLMTNYSPTIISDILNYLEYLDFEDAIEKATLNSLDEITLDAFNTTYN